MVNITIGNSYSKITGMTAKEEKDLRKVLSYTVSGSAAYFSGYGVRRKSLLTKRGEFPTGLIHRVKAFLGNQPWSIQDWPKEPKTVASYELNPNLTPYSWQINAVNKAISVSRGTISACTGTGKSLVIALIAARLNVKTLVIVPTVEIREQLSKSLLDALGAKHKVTVRNIDARDLPNLKAFDCLIIDEAHHAAARTYQKLNKTAWAGIYYRYFLTATPFRNDTEETLLFEAVAGQVIYKLDYKEAVSKGYIVPIEAFYIELPKQKTDACTYQEVYKELVVNNVARNSILFSLLFNLYEKGKSTLCLVKEVQHGKNINYPTFVHGQSEDRKIIQEFNQGKTKSLVGTEGVISEGVDTKACEYVILAGLGKAKSRIMQAIGRCLRTYPGKTSGKVILIKDRSHKYCARHFKAQCDILKSEYGITPIKLDLE